MEIDSGKPRIIKPTSGRLSPHHSTVKKKGAKKKTERRVAGGSFERVGEVKGPTQNDLAASGGGSRKYLNKPCRRNTAADTGGGGKFFYTNTTTGAFCQGNIRPGIVKIHRVGRNVGWGRARRSPGFKQARERNGGGRAQIGAAGRA